MIGLKTGTVALSAPDHRWAELFEHERERLARALGEVARAIEHVGSTAIPGLEAKPIIDMMVAVDSYESFFPHVPTVEKLGYIYRGEDGIPRRHLFWNPDPCTVHLRFLEKDSDAWHLHLAFREAMRRSPQLRQQYLELKRDLARRFPHDREAYTAGKQEFICSILAPLLAERKRGQPPESDA